MKVIPETTFLLPSLGRYLCWWTISQMVSSAGSQCFCTDMVYQISIFLLPSLGRYLCQWTIIPRVSSAQQSVFSVLTWFIRYLCFYYHHLVDTSAGGLLVRWYHPPSSQCSCTDMVYQIYVFITITGSIPLLVDYQSDGIISRQSVFLY